MSAEVNLGDYQAYQVYTRKVGKRYSYALTQLGISYLDDEKYQPDLLIAFVFMQQLLLKAALKQWVSEAVMAGQK